MDDRPTVQPSLPHSKNSFQSISPRIRLTSRRFWRIFLPNCAKQCQSAPHAVQVAHLARNLAGKMERSDWSTQCLVCLIGSRIVCPVSNLYSCQTTLTDEEFISFSGRYPLTGSGAQPTYARWRKFCTKSNLYAAQGDICKSWAEIIHLFHGTTLRLLLEKIAVSQTKIHIGTMHSFRNKT